MAFDIDTIYKALANPVRREILTFLREPRVHFPRQPLSFDDGVCASEIAALLSVSQSTVSVHLATLRQAELVTTTRIGQWVFFKRNDAVIEAFLGALHREL